MPGHPHPARRAPAAHEGSPDGHVLSRGLPERVPARGRQRRARDRHGHLPGAGTAGSPAEGAAAEIVIIDTSGSMGADKIFAAQQAAAAALDEVHDGVWVAVIGATTRHGWPTRLGGRHGADGRQTRAGRQGGDRPARPDGGTAMGTWLRLATSVFATVPGLAQKHAILLTDGINQHETPEQLTAAIQAAQGQFQCDCRGVGVRLAGRRGTPDRHGPARQRRPDRRAGADGGRLRADHARVDVSRGRRGLAPGVGAPGCPGPVRPPGLPHGRRPHRPAHRGQRADVGLPDGLLGRRGARLPRRRTAGGQGDRPGAARGAGPARRRRRRSSRRAWSRPCGPTTTP